MSESPNDQDMNEEENSEPTPGAETDNTEAQADAVDHMAEMAAAMADIQQQESAAEEIPAEPAISQSTSAEEIARTVSGSNVNIEALLKVPVSLSIEVGRTKMPLDQLLDTQEGSVIELERLLEEPLDILVNGALIAHGVVVLANERFGIQITDIISLEERARSL